MIQHIIIFGVGSLMGSLGLCFLLCLFKGGAASHPDLCVRCIHKDKGLKKKPSSPTQGSIPKDPFPYMEAVVSMRMRGAGTEPRLKELGYELVSAPIDTSKFKPLTPRPE